jgi:hypothetical protein
MKNCNMMRAGLLCLVLVVTASLSTGCGGDTRTHVVVIIDMSDGIDVASRDEIFTTIIDDFKSKKVHRGDLLTVIPVTSDAQTEGPGKVLNFEVKTDSDREVYDSDLKKLATDVETQLIQMQSLGDRMPYRQSDIIGAVRMASEEFARRNRRYEKRELLILSDMIQHNSAARFETEAQLNSTDSVRGYAATAAADNTAVFSNVNVRIGLLRSRDLKTLPAQRREAIAEFWKDYLNDCGARSVAFYTDGSTQVETLLSEP